MGEWGDSSHKKTNAKVHPSKYIFILISFTYPRLKGPSLVLLPCFYGSYVPSIHPSSPFKRTIKHSEKKAACFLLLVHDYCNTSLFSRLKGSLAAWPPSMFGNVWDQRGYTPHIPSVPLSSSEKRPQRGHRGNLCRAWPVPEIFLLGVWMCLVGGLATQLRWSQIKPTTYQIYHVPTKLPT